MEAMQETIRRDLQTALGVTIPEFPPFFIAGVVSCIFGMLLILTLFRRKLSSNDKYREMRRVTSEARIYDESVGNDALDPNSQDWGQKWIADYGKVWQSPSIKMIRDKRGITWDPSTTPPQGWYLFYQEFQFCWLDWLLAGCCTQDLCVVALGGSIYDITAFMPTHPGSQETLAEACGGDSTERFSEILHSSDAVALAAKYLVCAMPEGLTCGIYQEPSKINRKKGSRRGYITAFQQGMRHELLQAEAAETACNAAGGSAEAKPVSPKIKGFMDCPKGAAHFGKARAFYDPLEQSWKVWWTCCGRFVKSATQRARVQG